MNWGKCDYKELQRLNEKLKKLEKTDFDAVCRRAADKLAQILLAKVVKRTPVGVKPKYEGGEKTVKVTSETSGKTKTFLTKERADYETMILNYWKDHQGGALRRAWQVLPVEKTGDQYVVTVVNELYYASYVEFGHRQTPGRYVPALGKALKASWVKGKFMLTISEKELTRLAPKMLEAELDRAVEEAFNGK